MVDLIMPWHFVIIPAFMNDCLVGNIPEFTNRRNALIQVKGEKVVLHHYRELAGIGLSFLKDGESLTEKEVCIVTSLSQTVTSAFIYLKS